MNTIQQKIVLGTAQFGSDYGIKNILGQPTKKEVFQILSFAWEKGYRRFDTAPAYRSENLLGEFVLTNGLLGEAEFFTKIPPVRNSLNYRSLIRSNLENSLNNLGDKIDTLFFHNPLDSQLLLKDPEFFKNIILDYPVSTLGVSVYEPNEVIKLFESEFELSFQFPFNILDRRFEHVKMPIGKRYARSIFLQGILASSNFFRSSAPSELQYLSNKYHNMLISCDLDPISVAISFVTISDAVDYFLIGVDSVRQLIEITDYDQYDQNKMANIDIESINVNDYWLDPRNWGST